MSQTAWPEVPQVGNCIPHVAGKSQLCIIAAVASNGVIGAGGKLPWRIAADLRFFKAQTVGHPVIMGRRTWESLGKALAGRLNVVVTGRSDFHAEGAVVAASMEAALAQCEVASPAKIFVIGGADLFKEALPLADCLILTEIHRDFDGDVRFPGFSRQAWVETWRESQVADDGLRFDFVRYEKIRCNEDSAR